jgi:hypothetical protein
MVILILGGFLLSVIMATNLIIQGLKMANIQVDSTRAYFAAEAGAERVLWEARKNGYSFPGEDTEGIFSGELSNGSTYTVDYVATSSVLFRSVGSFNDVKRRVEVEY